MALPHICGQVRALQLLVGQISAMAGFPEVFVNLDPIVVMFLAWLVVVMSFFVLAIQLFITLIEFKLTTLAGFVLVPFALWNKTSFLAEKVLGNVVSSGIKVLVLAVIVGIGTGLFAEFQVTPDEPSIDHALVVMLASLTLLALGIFGPGVATGLVSGAPQLGAGAAAGTALAVAGTAVAVGAAATGVGGAVAAGTRMAPAAAKMAASGARGVSSTASSAKSAFQAGSAGGGIKGAAAGLSNVAKTGAQSVGQKVAAGAQSMKARAAAAIKPDAPASGAGIRSGVGGAANGSTTQGAVNDAPTNTEQPRWAKRLHRKQQISQAASTVAHTLRGGDGGGSGSAPSLRDPSDS